MPINNLAQEQLTASSGQKVIDLLKAAKAELSLIGKNLTPEERQKFGSIHEKNKLFISKVSDYHTNQPELQSPDVDWNTFDASWFSRTMLKIVEDLNATIIEVSEDIRILHDYDLFQMGLTDYDYTKYKAESTTATGGYTTKYEDLKQFFGNPTGINGQEPKDEGGAS
jgi:hypothetical protein